MFFSAPLFHKQYDMFSLPAFVSVIGGQEIKSFLIVTKSATRVLLDGKSHI